MSAASQSPWKPPEADRQPSAWSPPESDRKPPPELSPLAKAGKAFAETLGVPALLDILRASNRYGTPQEVAARGERGMAAAQGIVQGIASEPGRVRQEITNALDAFVAGNPRATAHHLLTAVPLVGEPINRAAQSFASGDPASGVGQVAALLAPVATAELPGVGSALADSKAAQVAGGAIKEGYAAGKAPAVLKVKVKGVPIEFQTVPASVAGAVTGATTGAGVGALVGAPGPAAVIGGAVGAVAPVVRGAIRGARRVWNGPIPESFTEPPVYASDILGEPAAAAAPPVVETPGMILARESGTDWAKLSPADRAMLETVAKAQANAAAQSAAAPPVPPVTPEEAAAPTTQAVGTLEYNAPAAAQPPAEAPAPAAPVPGKGNPAEIAAQLEASMRTEAITDLIVRKVIPPHIVENFGDAHWKTIAREAGVEPPNPQQITQILDNLAERGAAKNITATTAPNSPAEAAAEFQQNRALRNPGEEPPAAAAPEPAPPPQPETPPAGAAAPKHAIDVPGKGDLPGTKWMTEDGLREYAAENKMTEDAARATLAESGHKILGRAKLNRAIHALGSELGLDHDMVRDTASMTYGVKSLTQLTQDQMLQMYEHLAEQQSASQPLVGKSARVDALAEKLKVLADMPDAARYIEELKAQAAAAPEAAAPAAGETIPPAGETTPAADETAPQGPQTLRTLMQEPPAPKVAKPPATMSASEINRRLDQLDKKSSQLNEQFIEAGRGQDRPSDYSKKTDPLSSAMNAVHNELSDLRSEIARRYGPNAPSRLPRGLGPIKLKR